MKSENISANSEKLTIDMCGRKDGVLRAFCEGWDNTNLDTDRRVSHPLQRKNAKDGAPLFRGASYRGQQKRCLVRSAP
jgi:hypothetical protein